MSETPLLQVKGLEKAFSVRRGVLRRERGVREAVAGVSFDIHRGETFALVGESGCGKSTTAKCVLRLLEPTDGTVVFNGDDVLGMDRVALRRFRRKAQIVYQDPLAALNPRIRAGDVLREVLKVHGTGGDDPEKRVSELLERVGLGMEQAGQFPHQLSGGQRQRLNIARALSVRPEFLVLDEPVSALDVSVQGQVMNLLLDLQEEMKLTYLFIAHDLGLVRRFAKRVGVMYLGRIVEEASARSVFQDARHPYTRALLDAVPVLSTENSLGRAPTVLQGDALPDRDTVTKCAFEPRCPHPAKDADCRKTTPPLEAKAEGHLVACVKAPGGTQSGG